MIKYKSGDMVAIRKDLVPNQYYPYMKVNFGLSKLRFDSLMSELCGKYVTIKYRHASGNNLYTIKEDKYDFNWAPSMFERSIAYGEV